MEFKHIAILLCLVFGILLVIIEIRRANKARLVWRISSSIFAVTSLLFFLVPLQYKVETKDSPSELLLLTPGANLDSLKNLDKKRFFTTDPTVAFEMGKGTENIPDLFYYLKSHPEVKNIDVYGYGLNDEDLKSLSEYNLTFHPSPAPQGVLFCDWNQQVKTTDLLKVRGTYNNLSDKPVKLILRGFASDLDSITVKPTTKTTFSLKTQPKQIGKAIFKLVALQDQDTIKTEPIPFEVLESGAISVVVLASYPDFEYKFLKNWLFEKQYPLAFRSRISKDKYSTDFLNRTSINLNLISTALLNKTDLLLVDEEELAMLSAGEIRSINASVATGMGLFIRKTDINSKASITNRFKFMVATGDNQKNTSIGFKDQDVNFKQVLQDQELYIAARPNDQPIVTSAQNKVLVNRTLFGSGTIITSTIPATYQWLLTGNTVSYSTFWSTLIEKASRKKSTLFSWKIFPRYPLAGTKTKVVVDLNSGAAAPNLAFNKQRLSPRQNLELPFQWDAIGWPEKEGWNTLQNSNQRASFYIYKKDDWKDIRNYSLIRASENLKINKAPQSDGPKSVKMKQKIVSFWYYYALFLISAGYLWYESRILSRKS
jgi:hypothetical protein